MRFGRQLRRAAADVSNMGGGAAGSTAAGAVAGGAGAMSNERSTTQGVMAGAGIGFLGGVAGMGRNLQRQRSAASALTQEARGTSGLFAGRRALNKRMAARNLRRQAPSALGGGAASAAVAGGIGFTMMDSNKPYSRAPLNARLQYDKERALMDQQIAVETSLMKKQIWDQ